MFAVRLTWTLEGSLRVKRSAYLRSRGPSEGGNGLARPQSLFLRPVLEGYSSWVPKVCD